MHVEHFLDTVQHPLGIFVILEIHLLTSSAEIPSIYQTYGHNKQNTAKEIEKKSNRDKDRDLDRQVRG